MKTMKKYPTINLFETSIKNDKTWIIVKEYTDGNTILYSISDSDNILKALRKWKSPKSRLELQSSIDKELSRCKYTHLFFK